MFAAVLEKFNKPLRLLDDVQIPRLQQGQVLVKIHFAGICGSQLMEISGMRSNFHFLPHMLGHEATGTVIDVGPSVKKVQVGQTVLASWIKGSGISGSTPRYFSPKLGFINSGKCAVWMENAVVSENCLFDLREIHEPTNCFLGCLIPTTFGLLMNTKIDFQNKTFLINGLGGLGAAFLFSAIEFKIEQIFINDKFKKREDNLLKEMSMRNIEMVSSIDNNLNTKVDYAFDFSGSVEGIEFAFSKTKDNGTVIISSHPPKDKKIEIDPFDILKGKKLIGNWAGNSNLDRDLNRFLELQNPRQLIKKMMGNDIFELSDINLALDGMRNRELIRPIIKVN